MCEAIAGMETLNRAACEAMLAVGVHACTDITGFSLLGHALELAEASEVLLEIDAAALPVYQQAREMAAMGLVPAGSYNNRDHYLPRVLEGQRLPAEVLDILADPQTSGGLLMAVAAERLATLLAELGKRGTNGWVIGRVGEGPAGRLKVFFETGGYRG
jgi:selenide,water dikinase